MSDYLLLFMLFGGPGDQDLLAAIDAEKYFAARKIEMSAEQMLRLAQTDPKTGKDQVRQLLAIRWLGEQRVAAARKPLQLIAEGRLAQDATGFARDYARAALARIDGIRLPRAPLPSDSVREGLRWIPQDVGLYGVMDHRGCSPFKQMLFSFWTVMLEKFAGQKLTPQIYDHIEETGNIQIDRSAFALKTFPDPNWDIRLMMHMSGRWDTARVSEWVQRTWKDIKLNKQPGPQGETILRASWRNEIHLAWIGNTDLLVGGHWDTAGQLVDDLLAVRAGTKARLLDSDRAKPLKTFPADTFALLVGFPPKHWTGLQSFHIHMTAGPLVHCHCSATYDDRWNAERALDEWKRGQELVREKLQQLPPLVHVVPGFRDRLYHPVDTLELKRDNVVVEVHMEIPEDDFTLVRVVLPILMRGWW